MTTWFSEKLWDAESVASLGAGEVPAAHQVGQNVWLHRLDDNDEPLLPIDAILAEVSIGANHAIRYSLLIEAKCGLWVKIDSIRGWVTNPGEYFDLSNKDGGMMSVSEIETMVADHLRKPTLSIVRNTDKKDD